jgi:pyruvate/2-oxoglutarate dehydrogenase complex dihydrolipoamide dehydrogenase (E3) component
MNGSKSYQVAVIGSGAGGREAAIRAARNGLRVVLVESDGLGGTSFHRGYQNAKIPFDDRSKQDRERDA